MRIKAASILLLLAATAAHAQFTLGPRYSNYSTDVSVLTGSFDTSRQHAFGLVGGFRSPSFVLDFNVDHDPENGLAINFFTDQYKRTRGEVTVGYALQFVDLQVGARVDTITLGDEDFGGFFFGSNVDHQALVGGVKFHTPPGRHIGFYALARGYAGTFNFDNADENVDSAGWRGEAAVTIPLGESAWRVEPGIEYERLESEDDELTLETNRFFINFVYTFQRD